MWCVMVSRLTTRAAMNVSTKLSRTTRARGRVSDGSICGIETLRSGPNVTRLNGAGLHRFAQRAERIPGGHEFVSHEAGETSVGDRPGDRVPVQLLRVVELVPAGHATGVKITDVVRMLPNRANDVPFHDLHVIDVVEKLHPRRIDAFHHPGAERRVVTLIVVMIDLAVQQLDTDRDAMALGERRDSAQTSHACLDALRIRASLPIAEHGNQIRDALLSRERQRALELTNQEVMICRVIEAARDEIVPDRGVTHRTDEPTVSDDRPVVRRQEIDGRQAHALTGAAKKALRPACSCVSKIRFQARFDSPTTTIFCSGAPGESFTCTSGMRPGQRTK